MALYYLRCGIESLLAGFFRKKIPAYRLAKTGRAGGHIVVNNFALKFCFPFINSTVFIQSS